MFLRHWKYVRQIHNNIRYFSTSVDLIQVLNEDGVRRITMVDKGTRNSLSLKMTESLLKAVTKDISKPNLRCIVISALGDVFSAGHNLKQLAQEDGAEVFSKFETLMMSMVSCPVPIITAIDGLAAAAGCQLVAQSDIAICTERSSFSTPGANFGIFCSTPGIPLARSVPRKLCAYMLFTGIPITSEQALQNGLISKVTSNDNLELELKVIIDAIKSKSRSVIELGKRFYYEQLDLNLETAYNRGVSVMTSNLKIPDGQEGIRSFIEKRNPNWKHTY
uniref:Enoyl-CoA hydratase domain-containing protein 3, mitochondrial n=1 Tax=Rhodnius prolixus TaxID=13249 RepID=T1HN66_RHOPR